jgi:hypothetical protein
MRACSIRLFGSAYQPGVLLGFGARLRFFLQKFSNFVWVLKKRITEHVFPVWEVESCSRYSPARHFARHIC